MSSFIVHTVGCKVNQYETQAVAALLQDSGLAPADAAARDEPIALIVVNTCCVTSRAAAKSRQAIRRAVKQNRRADVLILGCCATQGSEALRQAALQAGCTGHVHVAGHRHDVAACAGDCATLLGERDLSNRRVFDGTSQPTEKPSRRDRGRGTTVPSTTGCVGNEGWMRAAHPALPAGVRPGTACPSIPMRPDSPPGVKENLGTAGLPAIEAFAGRQRAIVKVQDGCDAYCTYCIVPHVRPNLWWRPEDEILREVETLTRHGHKEAVLCGVNLGAYGHHTAIRRRWTRPSALPGLLRRVAAVEALWRVRISSLDVSDVTDELLHVFTDCHKVAPHLHLPLQSGSTRILRRMNRQYTAAQFLETVGQVRRRLELPAVTTDVLVGFPGETDEDFAATTDLARRAAFSKIHIFPFSPRPGTAAWKWRRQAPPTGVIRKRCARLAELEAETARAYRERFIGRTEEVLVERPSRHTPGGHARGLTDRYIEVTFPVMEGTKDPIGQVVRVQIVGLSDTGLTGKLCDT